MVGKRIKEIRNHFDLSQQDLADKLMLNKTSISLFENNKRTLSQRTLRDLCELYNLNENWILTGEGNMITGEGENMRLVHEIMSILNTDDIETLKAVKKMILLSTSEINVLNNVMDQFNELKEKR